MAHRIQLAFVIGLMAVAVAADPGDPVPPRPERSPIEQAEEAARQPVQPALVPDAAGDDVAEVALPALDYDLAAQLGSDPTAPPAAAESRESRGGAGWDLTPSSKALLFYLAVFGVGIAVHLCLMRPPRPPGRDLRTPGAVNSAGRPSPRQPTPKP